MRTGKAESSQNANFRFGPPTNRPTCAAVRRLKKLGRAPGGWGAVVAQWGWEQPGKGGQKPSFDFVKMSFFLGDILD